MPSVFDINNAGHEKGKLCKCGAPVDNCTSCTACYKENKRINDDLQRELETERDSLGSIEHRQGVY